MPPHVFVYITISFVAATIAAQLWTERQFIYGSKMSCRWHSDKPCSVRAHFHLYLMLATRFMSLANIISLLYIAYRHNHFHDILDVVVVFPKLLVVAALIFIGHAYKHWSKKTNGH